MNKLLLEACVDSPESVAAACLGGANRLELCSSLLIGGVTPSIALYEEIKKDLDVPVRVLIRPRFGDFCYTDAEFSIINREVAYFRQAGAQGVVIGILTPEGNLHLERMKRLMETAGDMQVTLHRAFDVCREPFEAMEQAISLGIDTILTAGQKNTCREGKELLQELVKAAKCRIAIMAGSGVDAGVIGEIHPAVQAPAYHMSGKVTSDSKMVFRREGVSMGLPSFSEYQYYHTDIDKIREARRVLDQLGQTNQAAGELL